MPASLPRSRPSPGSVCTRSSVSGWTGDKKFDHEQDADIVGEPYLSKRCLDEVTERSSPLEQLSIIMKKSVRSDLGLMSKP